jgi:serine/threonine-protein kinase RsbW
MSVIQVDRVNQAAGRGEGRQEPPYLQASYGATAGSIPVARHAITDVAVRAGAGEERLHAIRLASSEALSNVVQHAYPGRVGSIFVTASVAGEELWVLISDDGCGLRAGRASEGLGLGLALIAQMSDGFTLVERSSGGTEVRLRFVLRA